MFKPVQNGRITSEYGDRVNPFDRTKKEFHPGIDIAPANKSVDPRPNIYCVWKSEVVVVGFSQSFGNRVWVKLMDGPHAGLHMVYPHMESINIRMKPGKIIEEGTLIGVMGSTGRSTGVHTHLEIRPNIAKPGNSVNPVEIRQMYG